MAKRDAVHPARQAVPQRWTMMARITRVEMVTVRAASAEAAVAAFDNGEWERDTVQCDLVDWQRQGDPFPE